MNQVRRVGVIGLGRMGQQHVRVYSTIRRAQLAGVCDTNSEVGARIAQKYDIPFFTEMDELLDQVDAVSIVTPTPYHFDIAKRCLEHGIHILVEKPITQTVEEAQQLVELADRTGLVVQIGHIERFNPAYVEMKNVLEELTVVAVNFRRLSAYAGSNTDVDVVLDLMIHDADLVLDLAGKEPVWMAAGGISAFGKAVDYASAQLRFDAGPLMFLTASRLTEEKVRSIEITALEAYVEANLLTKTVTVHRRTIAQYVNQNSRGVKYRQEGVVEAIVVPVIEPLSAELQHFLDCIVEGQTPLVTPRDGLRALRLALSIRDATRANLVNIHEKTAQPALTDLHLLAR